MTRLGSPSQLLDLTDKVVVVTGAGGGIGTGIVRRMKEAGATVVAVTRTSPVETTGVTTLTADLADPRAPTDIIEATLEAHGRIDGLVNNAGIQPVVPFVDLTDEQWSEMIDINLTAPHRLTQAAATAMRDSGGGSIVHVASIEAHHPTPVHGHYAVSKAGLVMHARAAALAWGNHRIRVNSVSPGLIDRPGIEEQWPEGVQRWRAAVPLQRLGTPEDIGDACVFLCSDLSRWITGIDLVIDGGVLTNTTW
ncbi:MAG TPA: SDR family oxidoreductase [Acidimicrobiia bacterium]|nr:SDR family oxidoreductase [Acidimicrobiia bacterium]